METRAEHVQWCKDRAMEYLDHGDLAGAVTSMTSDMSKRDDCNMSQVLLPLGMMYVINHDFDGVKRWVEGFR